MDRKAGAVFMMLRDARIYFDGTAAQLRAAADPYITRFLADPARHLILQTA